MCYGLRNAALKFTFYGLVIAIWAAAACFIGIGSYLAADNPTTSYSAIFQDDYDTEVWNTCVYATIVVGIVIAGIAFIGFCGVRRETSFLLFLFCLAMIVFVVIELVLVIMSGVFKDDVKDNIADTMYRQVKDDYKNETSGDNISKDWNKMQQDLKCCASYYYPDWVVSESVYFRNTGKLVPYTCCVGQTNDYVTCLAEASRNISTFNYLHTKGCAWEMLTLVEDQMAMIVATLSIAAAIQIGAIVTGCILRDNYKHGIRK